MYIKILTKEWERHFHELFENQVLNQREDQLEDTENPITNEW